LLVIDEIINHKINEGNKMVFFKKKIRSDEAPLILEEVIKIIVNASGQSLKDFIKSLFDRLNIPSIQIDLPIQSNFTDTLVKTIMRSINNDQALIALKKIKKFLDKYKV